MKIADHPTLRCGNVAIDFEGCRLLRDGVPQALEPKAFAVLALLSARPGKTFGRDEILDAVWGHRHVTPGVLNRVITMLRHSLDEDAHAPRYLHTVHGVGYRFDLPESVPAAEPAAVPEIAADPVLSELADEHAHSTLAGPATEARLRRTARTRRTDQLGLRLLLVLAALAVVWFGWGFIRSAQPPTAILAETSVASLVVLPLHAIGSDPRDAMLADGLTEELTTTLARVPALRVTSRTSATLAAAEEAELAAIGQRLGVASVLEGSVRSSGDRLRVSLRLVDVATGHTRWAQDYNRRLVDLLVLEREVAQAVSGALQRNLEAGTMTSHATPSDPDRYLRYLLARKLARTETAGDLQKAIALFHGLLKEDPTDARAHEGLAEALFTSSFFAKREAAIAIRKQAVLEAQRAIELNPDLAGAHGVLSHKACAAALWEQCLNLLRRAVELAPSAPAWRINYAWRLAALGYLPEGLQQAEAAIEASPLQHEPRWLTAHILDALGEHEHAHQQLLASGDWQQTSGAWFNAVWRQRHGEAMDLAKQYPEARWRQPYVAVTAALQNPTLWPAAYAAIELSEKAPSDGAGNWVRLLVPDPDIADNLRMVERELLEGHSLMAVWIWAPELAAHRRHPAFQEFLKRNHILEYWNAHGWPGQCRPAADGSAVCG